jgi:hypothetical protein
MKKVAFLMLAVMLAGATASYAAETASYDEMKAIKAKQRADREARKGSPAEPTKMQKFWKNEGERSGLGESSSRMGSFMRNLDPRPFFRRQKEQYDARNTGGVK